MRLKNSFLKLPVPSLIENPIDLYYFTGIKLSSGQLYHLEDRDCLFVDGRYLEIAKKKSPFPVRPIEQVNDFLKGVKELSFDSQTTTYHRYQQLLRWPIKWIPAAFHKIRLIKDKQELALMHKSAQMLRKGIDHLQKSLKKGVSERELARSFEIYCLKMGAERLAFEPIIAFGKNSAMPHYRAGDVKLKEGMAVLVDVGLVWKGYCSDMTRVFFYKKADPFLQTQYEVVKKAQAAALKLCQPGTAIGMLDEAARVVLREAGVESHFVHGLGHGVGLEVHEYPRIKSKGEDADLRLEKGMVITIEPGLYFAGKGGVRYEDTFAITEQGYRRL